MGNAKWERKASVKRLSYVLVGFLVGVLSLSGLGNECSGAAGMSVSIEIEVDKHKPDGRKWDTTGAPDISGRITFPDGQIVQIPKHQNSYEASVSAGNVIMKSGDEIHVYLEDRDLSQHDVIASGFIKYPGDPRFSGRVGSAKLSFRVR